jgi:hypothetical protein
MQPNDIKKIQDTIRATVNGKIDSLNQKLDDYIKSDNKWKEQAQPAINLGNNVRGWGIVTAAVIGIIAGAAEIISVFIKIFKK